VTTAQQLFKRVLTTRVAWPILLTIALLCTASILAIGLSKPDKAAQQQVHILIGIGVMAAVLLFHYQHLGQIAYALFGLAIVLLVAVLFTEPINGSRRWFDLPGHVAFQPSEVAKVTFVMALAWYLRFRKDIDTWSGLLGPFAFMIVPFGLILIEPDLGTALLFPLVLFAMLVAAGAKLRHLLIIAIVAAAALPGAYPLLREYQQKRIQSFVKQVLNVDDPAHRKGPGYQQYQSIVAIGSGGTTGLGLEEATHIRHGLLPEAHTDFIFAVVATQWGFVGCVLILLFYLAFMGASIEIGAAASDPFGRVMVAGLASLILFQAMINIAMTTGSGPVVGIALPFISYGGSSLLTNMVATGLILNVSIRR